MTSAKLKALFGAVLIACAAPVAAQDYKFVPGQGMTFSPKRSAAVGDPAEGHCIVRVWVDDRATILMRGEQISVRTQSGRPARDEGSHCSGPVPTNVTNFRIESTSETRGKLRIQEPSQRNDYTGAISIDDPQDGGRLYVLDVWWRDASYNPRGPRPVVGGPVFEGRDHEAACQRNVLHDLRERNGRGVEVDFRRVRTEDQGRRETIRGSAIVRDRRDEARITYQCVVDNRNDRVVSAAYEVRRGDAGIR